MRLSTMLVVTVLIVALLVVSVVTGCGKGKKQGNVVAPDPAKMPGTDAAPGGKTSAPPSPSAVPGGGKAGPGG